MYDLKVASVVSCNTVEFSYKYILDQGFQARCSLWWEEIQRESSNYPSCCCRSQEFSFGLNSFIRLIWAGIGLHVGLSVIVISGITQSATDVYCSDINHQSKEFIRGCCFSFKK